MPWLYDRAWTPGGSFLGLKRADMGICAMQLCYQWNELEKLYFRGGHLEEQSIWKQVDDIALQFGYSAELPRPNFPQFTKWLMPDNTELAFPTHTAWDDYRLVNDAFVVGENLYRLQRAVESIYGWFNNESYRGTIALTDPSGLIFCGQASAFPDGNTIAVGYTCSPPGEPTKSCQWLINTHVGVMKKNPTVNRSSQTIIGITSALYSPETITAAEYIKWDSFADFLGTFGFGNSWVSLSDLTNGHIYCQLRAIMEYCAQNAVVKVAENLKAMQWKTTSLNWVSSPSKLTPENPLKLSVRKSRWSDYEYSHPSDTYASLIRPTHTSSVSFGSGSIVVGPPSVHVRLMFSSERRQSLEVEVNGRDITVFLGGDNPISAQDVHNALLWNYEAASILNMSVLNPSADPYNVAEDTWFELGEYNQSAYLDVCGIRFRAPYPEVEPRLKRLLLTIEEPLSHDTPLSVSVSDSTYDVTVVVTPATNSAPNPVSIVSTCSEVAAAIIRAINDPELCSISVTGNGNAVVSPVSEQELLFVEASDSERPVIWVWSIGVGTSFISVPGDHQGHLHYNSQVVLPAGSNTLGFILAPEKTAWNGSGRNVFLTVAKVGDVAPPYQNCSNSEQVVSHTITTVDGITDIVINCIFAEGGIYTYSDGTPIDVIKISKIQDYIDAHADLASWISTRVGALQASANCIQPLSRTEFPDAIEPIEEDAESSPSGINHVTVFSSVRQMPDDDRPYQDIQGYIAKVKTSVRTEGTWGVSLELIPGSADIRKAHLEEGIHEVRDFVNCIDGAPQTYGALKTVNFVRLPLLLRVSSGNNSVYWGLWHGEGSPSGSLVNASAKPVSMGGMGIWHSADLSTYNCRWAHLAHRYPITKLVQPGEVLSDVQIELVSRLPIRDDDYWDYYTSSYEYGYDPIVLNIAFPDQTGLVALVDFRQATAFCSDG